MQIATVCIFFILVTSGQVNFRTGQNNPIGKLLFSHNLWSKGDRQMKAVPKCLVAPNRMVPNDPMNNVDLTRAVTTHWLGGRILKLFWQNQVSRDPSQREKHGGVKFVALGSVTRTLWQKNVRFEKQCLISINYEFTPKGLTRGQILDHISESPLYCVSSDFCALKLYVYLSWFGCHVVPGQLKRSPARLTENGESFALMTSFEIANVDRKSQGHEILTRKGFDHACLLAQVIRMHQFQATSFLRL